jgi:hypothetical protein
MAIFGLSLIATQEDPPMSEHILDHNEQYKQRLVNLASLTDAGVNAYGGAFPGTVYSLSVKAAFKDERPR